MPEQKDCLFQIYCQFIWEFHTTWFERRKLAKKKMVEVFLRIKPKMSRQKPRSVPIYRKADWDCFKSYMATKSSEILCRFQASTVEEIWNALKTALDYGIQQFIPIKKISSKCSLPWITQEIRRLMRKRDKLYQKQKSGSNKDRCHFKRVKHLVQQKIKNSHENYLADILGVGSSDGNESSGFSPKKLFSLIKNSRQDDRGISTLKDSENILYSGNVKKSKPVKFTISVSFLTLIPT